MTDVRYFTKLFLNPLDSLDSYLQSPDWTDNVENVILDVGSVDKFSLSVKIDSLTAIYDDTGTEIPESDYTAEITDDREVEITNDSDASFTVASIEYTYNTVFTDYSFGDINWQRFEPPRLMVVPDIFSIENGTDLICRVRLNFIYERSYQYSDFKESSDEIFTLMGLIIAQVFELNENVGDINIGEVEAYQGEIDDNYLESLSVELIYTVFIDWDEFYE